MKAQEENARLFGIIFLGSTVRTSSRRKGHSRREGGGGGKGCGIIASPKRYKSQIGRGGARSRRLLMKMRSNLLKKKGGERRAYASGSKGRKTDQERRLDASP